MCCNRLNGKNVNDPAFDSLVRHPSWVAPFRSTTLPWASARSCCSDTMRFRRSTSREPSLCVFAPNRLFDGGVRAPAELSVATAARSRISRGRNDCHGGKSVDGRAHRMFLSRGRFLSCREAAPLRSPAQRVPSFGRAGYKVLTSRRPNSLEIEAIVIGLAMVQPLACWIFTVSPG